MIFPPDVIETHSGLLAHPMDLQPGEVAIEDIAFALSNESRFGGHTRWCVADHCLLVARVLALWGQDAQVVLGGLLHDAHEAYLRDLPTPVKRQLPGYAETCDRAQDIIMAALGVPPPAGSAARTVKHADKVSCLLERDRRMPSRARGWPGVDRQDWIMAEGVRRRVECILARQWCPPSAEAEFLAEYRYLKGRIDA